MATDEAMPALAIGVGVGRIRQWCLLVKQMENGESLHP